MPLLSVAGLRAAYGSLNVLRGVDLEIGEGEVIALLGTNGAGKTTLLRCLAGLHQLTEGDILFQGISISGMAPHRIQAAGLALVPEGRQLFTELSVLENLELGAFRRIMAGQRKEFATDLDRVFALFPRLRERANQRAGLLSGGEQQMVAIARALVSRPKLLLLDEPSLGLAPMFVSSIFEIFKAVNQTGTTILLVEQMAHHALALCDRAYVLGSGKIQIQGPRAEMLAHEGVVEVYLGARASAQ